MALVVVQTKVTNRTEIRHQSLWMFECIQHQLDVRLQGVYQDRGRKFDASIRSRLSDACTIPAIDAIELRREKAQLGSDLESCMQCDR